VRPPLALTKALGARGIGVEAMDSRAAARAWGVLRAELRWVAGALYPLAEAAKAPKFDCFYVYPTISKDPGGNSDLVPGDEERFVAKVQAARFRAKCRVFAPVYRQVTLTALRQLVAGGKVEVDREMAFQDVKAAWDHYLANDNKGRGVVLIGHSQGARVLTELIGREIQGKPVQDRIVSAMLIGSAVPVFEGQDIGMFRMPLCRSADQSGCILTYASFRADFSPPPDSRFGKGDRPGTEAGCTNPAALIEGNGAGGKAVTQAYLPASGGIFGDSRTPPWTSDGAPVTTPFVKVPGLLSAECVRKDGFSYLAVTTNADPADPRTDTIGGDVQVGAVIVRSWGLHLIDMNVAMGDLVGLAGRQAKAWAAKRR
jgi:hypothetical protein